LYIQLFSKSRDFYDEFWLVVYLQSAANSLPPKTE
jgi:hypothetical protein